MINRGRSGPCYLKFLRSVIMDSRPATFPEHKRLIVRKPRIVENLKKYWALYLMFIPTAATLIIFNYIPMWGVSLAFKDYVPWYGFSGSEWVGWDNFRYVFSTTDFPRLIRNTLLINVYKIAWGFPAPIIFCLLYTSPSPRDGLLSRMPSSA